MMHVGVNTDPRHWPDHAGHARDLANAYTTAARFPLVEGSGVDYAAFCRALLGEGIKPVPVFVAESGATATLPAWSATLGNSVDTWQIGNEPDGNPPSSWVMDQTAFTALLQAA